MLFDHADPETSMLVELGVAGVGQFTSEHGQLPGGRPIETGDQAQQCRLARAGRTEDRRDFTDLDVADPGRVAQPGPPGDGWIRISPDPTIASAIDMLDPAVQAAPRRRTARPPRRSPSVARPYARRANHVAIARTRTTTPPTTSAI